MVLVLFLAAALCEGRDFPPELLRRLRLTARAELPFQAQVVLGLAVLEVGDPHVTELAGGLAAAVDNPAGQKIREDFLRQLRAPLLELIPEEPPSADLGGFTIERTTAKVGRNDPCPCGSGRKYKRCCLSTAAPETPRADPAVPGGARDRFHRTMSDAQFATLHSIELARIDPAELTTSRLFGAIVALALYRLYDAAERFLAELATREELPEGMTPDEARSQIIWRAFSRGDLPVVERSIETFDDPEEVAPALTIGLAILRGAPDALDLIEKQAQKGLAASSWDDLGHLCSALIFCTPALGILVSRGVIDPDRPLDAERLLAAVEEARDMLLLPPNDPAWEIYDLLSEQHVEKQLEQAEADRSEKLAAEANQLRLAVAEARARESATRRELARREKELARATRDQEERREEVARTREGAGLTPEELTRLRGKIDEFKTRIAEGNEERRELRRQLSRLGARMEEALSRDGDPDGDPDGEGAGDAEEGAEPLELEAEAGRGHLTLRIPIFSREFREDLGNVADHVARDAVATAGALAAADAGAWYSVKHVRAIEHLRSARIGRHRILFHLEGEDELAFLRLIHRRDLEVTLRKMG